MHTRNPDKMLLLSNKLLELEGGINRLEHFRLDLLAGGNPILTDVEFAKLKILSEKIWKMKREMAEKTAELRSVRMEYYKTISRKFNCPISVE